MRHRVGIPRGLNRIRPSRCLPCLPDFRTADIIPAMTTAIPIRLFPRQRTVGWRFCLFLVFGLALAVPATHLVCADQTPTASKGSRVKKQSFGKVPDNLETHLFTFVNKNGVSLQVTDYGARIVAVHVPDRAGRLENVNLGFDSAEKYIAHTAYFGCTTGRFANRIGKGRFVLDGKEFKLATNNGAEHLHGGKKGFDRQVWASEEVTAAGATGVKFTHVSPDGDEGYPGELTTVVTYWLTDENEVKIEYAATTKQPTVLNLTNHAYWNLAGANSGKDVLKHTLRLESDEFLSVGEGMIPTGKKTATAGTFMDFSKTHAIGSRIEETHKAFDPPGGYDHCYVLRKPKAGALTLAARVEDPESGRLMEVFTTEPAVQFYSANFLDGAPENGGHKKHGALCLETQHYPDSPNRPEFPTTVLRPGERYTQTTVYKFSVNSQP